MYQKSQHEVLPLVWCKRNCEVACKAALGKVVMNWMADPPVVDPR